MLAGTTLAAAAAAAGCSEGSGAGDKDVARIAVSPAGGGALVRPDGTIAVQSSNGTIEDVTVLSGGTPVEGALSADRTHWRSRWTLDPGQTYTVNATAVGRDGRSRSAASRFAVAKVSRTAKVDLEAPYDRETVGIGIPIILRFRGKVGDRAAVERALEVRADRPVEGAWHWFEGEEGSEAVFRTREYWPAHTSVRFQAHLSGVSTAKDVYGGKNYTVNFKIGDSHISRAGEDSHKMVVKVNGRKARTIPTSMGRGGERKYTTTNGTHLTMEKGSPVTMTSEGDGCGPGCPGYYSETVYSAVRISDSGEYVHSAPWSVGEQGNTNVSHGCVNISPSNAKWFYGLAYRGDPVTVTGSDRPLEPDNGWGYWQMKWNDWVKGSALKRSVTTGPHADASTLSAESGRGTAPTAPRADGGH
ncbi:L,D-transpeptidase [Actinomadura roseirufa]|uniref:L,D-transpeptidase n=1 Tax=Actinomadura roseirufa TaxID=2094049 RepID=UPI0010411308|nr:Ig-like domain-containing protein [Actinomadura roseirufa]